MNEKVANLLENTPNVANIEGSSSVTLGSPERGNVVKLQILLDGQDIVKASFKMYGCGYAIACAAQLTLWLEGKNLNQAQAITAEQLIAELALPKQKWHCAKLVIEALSLLISQNKE